MHPVMFLILPPIAIVVGIYAAVRWWMGGKAKKSLAVKTGFLVSLVTGMGFVFRSLYVLEMSHSSTAGIGYLFLPYAVLLVCGATYLVVWSIMAVILFFCKRAGKSV